MNTELDSQRFDPILPVHKAMRHVMFEVLTQVGAMDPSDIFDVDRCARQVARLVALLPESAGALVPRIDALRQRDAAARSAAAAALYRETTALVTAQLVRQQQLEVERTPLLWAQHSDAELGVVRRSQLAETSEQDLAEALQAMAGALTPQELSAFVGDLQASVDSLTFACLLDALRRQMEPSRWDRVARELRLPTGGDRYGRRARTDRRNVPADAPPVLHRRIHRAERHRTLTQ